MSYELSWHIPGQVLALRISGEFTLEDAKHVNFLITQELEKTQQHLMLLIDAGSMDRPYNFQGIRSVQTYMNHPKMKRIVVAASDRVIRLAMTVIFNISRASLSLSDNLEMANTHLQRHIST